MKGICMFHNLATAGRRSCYRGGRYAAVCLAVVLALPVAAAAQSVYVPVRHWAYDFVERMETKGVIRGVLDGTRPYSRQEMAGYLVQVERYLQRGGRLNRVEQDQFDYLRFEFQEEFEALTGRDGQGYEPDFARLRRSRWVPDFVYRNGRNLLSWQVEDFAINVDPILYRDFTFANPDTVPHTDRVFRQTGGFTFWGRLGKSLGFYFNARDTREWGSRRYPSKFNITMPGTGFVNGYGSYIYHDETIAYLMFRVSRLQLMFGKDFNVWGHGYRGNLSLSDNATSYDQLKLQFRFWRLKFTSLLGFLRPYPPIYKKDGSPAEKNLAAHRLDVAVFKWLSLGAYETVIFGDRRFDPAYLNPIMFYRSAEHFWGNRDNVTMGADFKLTAIPRLKLYGEVFIDDLFISRLGSGYYGNKWAVQFGALWVDILGIPNLDARAEYTRVEPYVYTHNKPINTYQNFTTVLGHWTGPNSDDLFFQLEHRPTRRLRLAASAAINRHGANPPGVNVGGDASEAFRGGVDSETVYFLDGIVERRRTLRLTMSYELLRQLFVELQAERFTEKNIETPAGGRAPLKFSRVRFGIYWNR